MKTEEIYYKGYMNQYKKIPVDDLFGMWKRFKSIRNNSPLSFDHDHEDFLTVKEREALIDALFLKMEFYE